MIFKNNLKMPLYYSSILTMTKINRIWLGEEKKLKYSQKPNIRNTGIQMNMPSLCVSILLFVYCCSLNVGTETSISIIIFKGTVLWLFNAILKMW